VSNLKFNDLNLQKNEKVYTKLKENGIDDLLSQHIAHLFIRDPIVLFKEKLVNNNSTAGEQDADHFENIQSTNWQSMRFKPPPLPQNNNETSSVIGWRVEFRTPELQLTDFENSALCTFIILLVRAIQTFNLDFTIPISQIDVNMQTAQKINACQCETFYFKNDESKILQMSINEIINGSEEKKFRGLLNYISDYLDEIKDTCICDAFALCKINQYLLLVKSRANGDLMTLASFIRKLVSQHPDYKCDSVVNEQINYDLIWHLLQISNGNKNAPEFLFESFKKSCI
jgi:glutamate--cysteine ligase catalytic subunit